VSSAGSFMNWKYPTVTTKQPIRRINRSISVKRRTITAAVGNNLYYLYLRIENLHLIQKFINLPVTHNSWFIRFMKRYLNYHFRNYIELYWIHLIKYNAIKLNAFHTNPMFQSRIFMTILKLTILTILLYKIIHMTSASL